jgi:hypothetical protein
MDTLCPCCTLEYVFLYTRLYDGAVDRSLHGNLTVAFANVSKDFCKGLPRIAKAKDLLAHLESVIMAINVAEKYLPDLLIKATDFQHSDLRASQIRLFDEDFIDFCDSTSSTAPLNTEFLALL